MNRADRGEAILSLNIGSSSIKFALYALGKSGIEAGSLLGGLAERLGSGAQPSLHWSAPGGGGSLNLPSGKSSEEDFSAALAQIQPLLQAALAGRNLKACAHRVVHGGLHFHQPVLVDDAVMAQLRALEPFAPLHQPHNLNGIALFARAYPQAHQVACFDTAFHARIPEIERRFALPPRFAAQGHLRYGFHGLSYDYASQRLRERSGASQGRVLLAHLGSGASLCATRAGQSIASTMGFSTLDGLMMGTRIGRMDAGLLLQWLKDGMSLEAAERLLYKESGLLGVSQISADMKTLRQSDSPAAALAIAQFTHQMVRESGALIALLGGLDALVFTGGIGEHDAILRATACERFGFLGLRLDTEANASKAACGEAICPIHAPGSSVEVWVIPADEGRAAAEQAARVIQT